MAITPERMQELADMSAEDRIKALEEEEPAAAELFKNKKPHRTIMIDVREGGDDGNPEITVTSESHEDIMFVDLAVAVGDYIGRKAKSLSHLKSMMNLLRDAATEMASRRFIQNDPAKVMLEVLMDQSPETLKRLLEAAGGKEPLSADCANCEKPCPLAGKRMKNVPASSSGGPICVHLKGPSSVN